MLSTCRTRRQTIGTPLRLPVSGQLTGASMFTSGQACAQVGHMADPKEKGPTPPFPKQEQQPPGTEQAMEPKADHGERSYKGFDRLNCA